ncbi:unnamed protein product [Boreogadus saida]
MCWSCRQEGERLGAYAADVQLYRQFPAIAREDLALHDFLRGLAPECLRQHVRLTRPPTLNAALDEAEQAEVELYTRPILQRSGVSGARSGWQHRAPQGPVPPLQSRRPTLQGFGGHGVDHLPGAAGRFSGHHRCSLGGMVVDQRPPDVCDGAGDWNEGEKRRVGDQEVMHEIWLADIRDRCIIGLDLLTHWGARGDVAGAGHHHGCGDGGTPVQAGKERGQEPASSRLRPVLAAAQSLHSQRPGVCHLSFPQDRRGCPCALAAQWSSTRQLRLLLGEYGDIFAARDEDCRRTGLV